MRPYPATAMSAPHGAAAPLADAAAALTLPLPVATAAAAAAARAPLPPTTAAAVADAAARRPHDKLAANMVAALPCNGRGRGMATSLLYSSSLYSLLVPYPAPIAPNKCVTAATNKDNHATPQPTPAIGECWCRRIAGGGASTQCKVMAFRCGLLAHLAWKKSRAPLFVLFRVYLVRPTCRVQQAYDCFVWCR